MIKYFESFLIESRYFLENIDKKYYVFLIDKRYYLIDILKKDIKSGDIFLNVFNHYGKPPFLRGQMWDRFLAYYYMTFSNWKRHLSQIVFSTDNMVEAMEFIDNKKIKRPEIDPYGEEDWYN